MDDGVGVGVGVGVGMGVGMVWVWVWVQVWVWVRVQVWVWDLRFFQTGTFRKYCCIRFGCASQMPLMDLKNLQFSLEDRDYSKIN